MRNIWIIILWLILYGCAASLPKYKTTDVLIKIIKQDKIATQATCEFLARKKGLKACAVPNLQINKCTIYIADDASEKILKHELLHCIVGEFH